MSRAGLVISLMALDQTHEAQREVDERVVNVASYWAGGLDIQDLVQASVL
ncbi:MAG: hypothetical protein QNI91_17710 [Arenicellales bacterium]|nr:hypothetical protein [Arenicellales bacterium]